METPVNLSSEALQSLVKESPTSEGLLLSLAVRERHTHQTDLRRFRIRLVNDGIKVVEKDYINAWKQLESLGAGSIIYGRKGKADRFKWYYSLIDIAKMAFSGDESLIRSTILKKENANVVNDTQQPTSVEEKPTKRRRGRPRKQPVVASVMDKVLFIPLRKDKAIEIVVPSDLSKEEAGVLSLALHKIAKSA